MYIENEKVYWEHPKYKKKINEAVEDRENRKIEVTSKKQEEKEKPKVVQQFQHNLVLTEDFTAQLGLAELFRLSELQLELEKCTTQFAVVYTVGTSAFYENLPADKYSEREKENKRLFELIKLEELKKIKSA